MPTPRLAELPVVNDNFHVVGIGASAGGLGALRTLFSRMPGQPGFACVVIVHLSPEHESHLVELLQPYTSMPVQQVTRTMAIEPNHVYVIPPNANLNSIDTHLRLSELEERRAERAPIDHFLRTLAATHDGTAVGVILTGGGSDGALGLRQIKEQGGLTIVQDPQEAEYDGMPRSAIATTLVDVVAPLREIPERILGYCATRPQLAIPADGDALPDGDAKLLERIVDTLRLRTGRDCSVYRRSVLLRRIRHRMQVRQVDTLTAYLGLLRDVADEPQALVGALHHTLAEFFHQPDIFEQLEQRVIPELFARKSDSADPIRAWSIGCSTGEVAYSLAMLLLERASDLEVMPKLQVFATDSSDDMLKFARTGVYPEEVASTVPPARLERFFSEHPGHYRVGAEARNVVVFAAHDVFKDPPFSHLDLIVCPSLLEDLQPAVRRGVLRLFHFALEPDGLLVVGPTDEADDRDLFVREEGMPRILRRKDGPRKPFMPMSAASRNADAVGVVPAGTAASSQENPFATAHRRAVEKHVTPSVLVNADDVVVHYSPRAWRFLRIPGGELTHDIVTLVDVRLRPRLQEGLAQARRTGMSWVSEPLAVLTDYGPRRLLLRIEHAGDVKNGPLLVVIFDELADSGRDTGETIEHGSELPEELDRIHELLQRTTVRLSGLQLLLSGEPKGGSPSSTNGRLSAILDELQSSSAEMRVVNEAMLTTEIAQQRRLDELARRSSDSYQLLQSTGIATLFLDTDLRLLRFTPQAAEVFRVVDQDVGSHLSDLAHTLSYAALADDARRVLEHLTNVEVEAAAEGNRWYLIRMLPYRPVPGYISGIAITLLDISDRRRAEEMLRLADRRKDEFLALLAHELRNPLAPLMSGIEFLGEAAADHKMVQQAVPLMRRQMQQLVRIVDDLLEVSRITGGRLQLQRSLALLTDIVRDATASVAPLINQARQQLTINLGDEPIVLEADAARLMQVLSNLLNNASRYTPPGGRIDVTARRERDEAVITVVDTGVGMPEHVLRNIFEMFYRGSDARRVSASGLGIGLAIARQLVEMHGGTLTARSAGPGHGSEFVLRMPVSEQALPTSSPSPRRSRANGHRVLIVDDNRDAAEALSLQVKTMGAQVRTALSASDALGIGPDFLPDVVLLDLGMPDVDGFEAARQIRQTAWGRRVHLVALTGWGQDKDRQRTKQAGFDRHLTKPAEPAELESVLAQSPRGPATP
jgi:two-component system CheB/CheR fusion protein